MEHLPVPAAARGLLGRVSVTADGAVRLHESVVVDGHVDDVAARVTTHIHSDHIRRIRTSFRRVAVHIATELTHELLAAMGYRVPPDRRVDASYHTPLGVDGAMVTLLPANHVPGAAQVLVERDDGLRVGYTGDFKLPGTEVMRDLDVLVVDATYGFPEWRRPWQSDMEYLLPDLVAEALTKGPVHIYAYNGKVEEVVTLLRRMGVDAPVIVDQRRYRMLRVMERFGVRVGEIYPLGSAAAMEAVRSDWYIQFHGFGEWRRRRQPGTRMLLTGWEFSAPYRYVGPRDLVVSFSDHADFTQLVEYVSEARPRLLVVDSSRGGAAAEAFAEYARKRLGLDAVACPRGTGAGR